MSSQTAILKRGALVAAVSATLLLGGCGGVHLEGPGFEALGLTGSKKTAEKKVPERAPLLVPPDRNRLPEPQQQTAAIPAQNWPTDPDALRKTEEEEAKRKQQEYEDRGDWSKDADIDEFEKKMDESLRKKGIFTRLFKGGLLGE